MKVAVLSSVSEGTPWASMTSAVTADYCRRHGYTFIARSLPYVEAVADFRFWGSLLGTFDALWCLDADAVITNHTRRLEDLPLRPGMNVCKEGLFEVCPINCGSVIWMADDHSRRVLSWLAASEHEWRQMTWIWQQWIAEQLERGWWKTVVTVHPPRTFNSCHHGDRCLWAPGDFVYHPCGMPHHERLRAIRETLKEVVS